jgi:hypothetical protein
MRRCGRMSCLVGAGLLVATLAAGGAFAAPGGNGKGLGGNGKGLGHQANPGKGLALAKGHAKRASAAPQLTPDAPAPKPSKSGNVTPEPARASKPAQPRGGNASPPGQATRHNHVTICHATGSGRYILISPNVNGVLNGHLKHHDDFVYTGSCSRPSGNVGGRPPEEPAPTTHPPRDPPAVEPGRPIARPSGDLPFTGVSALYLAVAGGVLVAAGLLLGGSGRLPQDDEGIDRGRA